MKFLAKSDPDELQNKVLLREYDMKLRAEKSGLYVRRENSEIFESLTFNQPELKQALPAYDLNNDQIRSTFNISERFYAYAKFDFQYSDGERGSIFVIRERSPFADLEQIVSKAMQRDVKSVHHWMSTFYSENGSVTRGETAVLLQTAQKAIPSEQAQIQSIRSLNALTLIVTFDKPLTAADEVFAKAKTDFVLSGGLTLTNMPRLKTGSIATYIVPTSVQKAGEVYSLTYKGQKAGSFEGSDTKLNMTDVRQVTNDTFEMESLQANGVVDYGYIISAYSGGRGANAFVLNDQEQAGGKTYQIIPSMQARQVVITPEGGEPIVAKYVPFTQ